MYAPFLDLTFNTIIEKPNFIFFLVLFIFIFSFFFLIHKHRNKPREIRQTINPKSEPAKINQLFTRWYIHEHLISQL